MEQAHDTIRALALLSGGLDSILAACVVREQGIDVVGISFESPFFDAARARTAAAQIELPLRVIDFTAVIAAILEQPKHGFGSCMNPCIDCHAAMIRKAGEILTAEGFHFIVTGEVLQQRPMSQNRRSLDVVATDSGVADLLLRPLSARLLPETEPERRGWVDRSKLHAISGRTRKAQFELAARFGIRDYVAGAGGCRLTEPNFSARLRELQGHEGVRDARALRLLRFGRHFRLGDTVKLVVGRDQDDNALVESAAGPGDFVLKSESVPGPTGWLASGADEGQIQLAAAICARYSDSKPGVPVTVDIRGAGGGRRLEAVPAAREAAEARRIG